MSDKLDMLPQRPRRSVRRCDDIEILQPTLDEHLRTVPRTGRPRNEAPSLIIAGKEVRDGLRNRWVLATTLLLAALALTLAFLGSAPTGTVGVGPLRSPSSACPA